MIVVTTENIAGHKVKQTLGQCFGVVVRSRGLGGNMMAGLHGALRFFRNGADYERDRRLWHRRGTGTRLTI